MKRLLIIPLIVFLLSLCYSRTYGQTTYKLFDKLKAYTSTHPTEKAYLHFDQPYYATGDTVYFKAYVAAGERHELSAISGILHVDLINTLNKIDQSIKLQLVNGLGWGDFALPDTLPPGKYRIRAYTQWMRNEGNYFEQAIPVGSVHGQKIPESATKASAAVSVKSDIQFMPEGGSLVTGILSKVAFKAIDANGLGINVKGEILDNENKEVCSFASSHLGMGYFLFRPQDGKTYKAKVTYANGTTGITDLPKALVNGIVLTINNDSLSKASVRIEANKTYFDTNKGKAYTLLIYSGGFATSVSIKLDSIVSKLDILKRRLRTGITRVTLFSDTDEPLCERQLFVQNYDQLNLDLKTDQPGYAARGKVNITLNARNRADSAIAGHFSVAIMDESKVVVNENDESTILNNLLLTSDLKGTVEQPNYYFTDINDDKLKELDLVMLTHGYRRFEWKQVLSDNNQTLAWQPEKDLEITGTAKSGWGKLLSNATVSLISSMGGPLLSQKTDNKGNFRFSNLIFMDTTRFVLQAVNVKGKNHTKLTYNEDTPIPVVLVSQTDNVNSIIPGSYLANNERQQEELNKLGLGKGRLLKEVKIKARKLDDQYETQSLAGAGHADQVMHSKEIGEVQGPLSISLNGRLRGVVFLGPFPHSTPFLNGGLTGPMLVIIDGSAGGDLNSLNAGDVETIEVLRFAGASIYGMQSGDGVLVITTKRSAGTDWKDIASVGILPIAPLGFYKAREFYSPKYENNDLTHQPDLRSTIYWNPELVTDKDGNASFNYYNADGTGTYRIVIEGMDEKGNLGRKVFRYKVD